MTDEKTNEADTKGKETDTIPAKPEESLSIVDEAKKVRDEIKAENDRREEILKKEEKLTSEKLLGGTGGEPVEAVPAKEETPKEYRDRIDKEISEGKHDD